MGRTKSVGIYAGAQDFTLVEVTKRGGRDELTQLVQQTIPQGTQQLTLSSLSADPKSLQASKNEPDSQRQQLKESFKLEQETPLCFSYPAEPVLLRYFKMLKIPKKEWEVAIRFEARKYLPFNMEQMQSDFIILPLVKGSSEIEVVFFAVDQAYAQRWVSFLQEI